MINFQYIIDIFLPIWALVILLQIPYSLMTKRPTDLEIKIEKQSKIIDQKLYILEQNVKTNHLETDFYKYYKSAKLLNQSKDLQRALSDNQKINFNSLKKIKW